MRGEAGETSDAGATAGETSAAREAPSAGETAGVVARSPAVWFGLLFAVAFAAIGIWWLMTLAYASAKAQTLAPFEYTALIWSSILGFVFFREVPSLRLYAGAAVIIAACLVVAFETHFTARREARAAAAEIAP